MVHMVQEKCISVSWKTVKGNPHLHLGEVTVAICGAALNCDSGVANIVAAPYLSVRHAKKAQESPRKERLLARPNKASLLNSIERTSYVRFEDPITPQP